MDRERHPLASRRTILRGLAAALPAATIAAVGATGHAQAATAALSLPPDATTLDLIEGHRRAYAAFDTALEVDDGQGPDVPATSAAETAAIERLLEREPTTLQGLRAFAEYLDGHLHRTLDDRSLEWALATIAEATRRLIPTPTA